MYLTFSEVELKLIASSCKVTAACNVWIGKKDDFYLNLSFNNLSTQQNHDTEYKHLTKVLCNKETLTAIADLS
jgi:hypothetical protein